MNKPRKRWSQYQVDNAYYNPPGATASFTSTVKTVADLTEAQAKDELCIAMDLIEKLLGHGIQAHENMLDAARRAKYI